MAIISLQNLCALIEPLALYRGPSLKKSKHQMFWIFCANAGRMECQRFGHGRHGGTGKFLLLNLATGGGITWYGRRVSMMSLLALLLAAVKYNVCQAGIAGGCFRIFFFFASNWLYGVWRMRAPEKEKRKRGIMNMTLA